jgi:hypothetical protein
VKFCFRFNLESSPKIVDISIMSKKIRFRSPFKDICGSGTRKYTSDKGGGISVGDSSNTISSRFRISLNISSLFGSESNSAGKMRAASLRVSKRRKDIAP